MKHVFYKGGNVAKTIMRDAHAPEEIAVKVETNERPGLEAAERIRSNELMRRDQRTGIADGGVIAFSFSFPTTMDYTLAKRRDPDLFRQLSHGSDDERFRAAEKLEILYPQYVTTVRRNDSRRRHARKTM